MAQWVQMSLEALVWIVASVALVPGVAREKGRSGAWWGFTALCVSPLLALLALLALPTLPPREPKPKRAKEPKPEWLP
jgi:hypothetical protein